MDPNYSTYAQAAAFLGAAIAMGVGSLGPALGQGMIGQKACEGVGKYPESYTKGEAIEIPKSLPAKNNGTAWYGKMS